MIVPRLPSNSFKSESWTVIFSGRGKISSLGISMSTKEASIKLEGSNFSPNIFSANSMIDDAPSDFLFFL